MKPAFKRLHFEKQNNILIAAIEEYFKYGFDNASTNRIVDKANISKGALYYYFGSKSDLYLACQTHTFNVFKDFVKTYTQSYEGFIERLIRVNHFKQKFQSQYPEIFNFFIEQYYKALFPDDILREIQSIEDDFKLKMSEDINLSLFKDDINIEHAMQLIRWTIQGYEQEVKQQTIDNRFNYGSLEQCFKDSEVYFETLKTVYYK